MLRPLFLFLFACVCSTVCLAQNIQQQLDTLLRAYNFNGTILVAQDNRILLEKGYGYSNLATHQLNDTNTVFQIASVTKTFTSSLILKLVEQKQLSLQDKLSKFYPDFPKADSITIENLLTHTSGIPDYTGGNFLDSAGDKPASEATMLALFKDKPFDFSPGTGWSYSNSAYSLLGYIVPKVTGLTYEQAIRKYIFTPLHMDHSGFDFTHLQSAEKAVGYATDSTAARIIDSSVCFAAGAVYSTVGDMYKWHEGLQHHTFIRNGLLEQAYTPFKNNYGYGWIVDSVYGRKMVSHSGGIWGFRSNFVRIVADDVCIVLLTNTETSARDHITHKILAVLYHQPYTLPLKRTPVKLSEAVLQRYIGTYNLTEKNLKIAVKLENGELAAYPERGPWSVLLALDEQHFYLKGEDDFRVDFEVDGKGEVKEMVINNDGRIGTAEKVE